MQVKVKTRSMEATMGEDASVITDSPPLPNHSNSRVKEKPIEETMMEGVIVPCPIDSMVEENAVPVNIAEPIGQETWPITKTLTLSDVDVSHPCLTLPRQSVEKHIPIFGSGEERRTLGNHEFENVKAHDAETSEMYEMRLRKCGTYYKLSGKWGRVIRTKRLMIGMEIKLRWDNGLLYFSVPVKPIAAPPLQTICFSAESNGGESTWPIEKALTLSDVDVNHPFLTLSGHVVEEHVLVNLSPEVLDQLKRQSWAGISARDVDSGERYDMKLKKCGTYYRLIGKWGQIVRKKGLEVGKVMRMHWDDGFLVFTVSGEPTVVHHRGRVLSPRTRKVPAVELPSVPPPSASAVVAVDEVGGWTIRKALTPSDVDVRHPFLTLSGQHVRDHIVVHWNAEERERLLAGRMADITAHDDDNGDFHVMKLRWCGTYYKLIGRWGRIVRDRKIVAGTKIKLRWHINCLHFSLS